MPRLFYASFPSDDLRTQLETLLTTLELPGRATAGEKLHLTLLFLGQVAEEVVTPLKERTSRLLATLEPQSEPLILRFDRIEHWLRPQVVSLVASEVPEPLLHLHRTLCKAARAFCIELEERDFRPHITLARKARRRFPHQTLKTPVLWPISEVALVASELRPEGARYHCLARWPCLKP